MIGSNDIRLGISLTKYYELRRWYEFLPLGGKESQCQCFGPPSSVVLEERCLSVYANGATDNLNYLDWHRSCTRQLLVGATNCLQDVSPNLRGLVLGRGGRLHPPVMALQLRVLATVWSQISVQFAHPIALHLVY